jgi:cobalt/nickel transport protein
MRTSWSIVIAVVASGIGSPRAQAHFHLLLPAAASARRGEEVVVSYRWGHPFEHQLFDAQRPQAWSVSGPDGGKVDLITTAVKDLGQKPRAYQVQFTPNLRGDYTFFVRAAPVWIEEDGEFLEDTVKVVLHVQAQRSWDAMIGLPFELVPLTRPYGIPEGSVFQAQAIASGKPLAGAMVEIERYNPVPPKERPPDEQITRTAKTDPNGIVTATLTEPGWWSLTAVRSAGTRKREGRSFPVRQRTTFWVYVDAKVTPAGK